VSLALLEFHDSVAVLSLYNGVTNAINPQMVRDLEECMEKVKAQAHGLVIAGGEKFFSIGFDLPLLLSLDRVAMTDFFNHFNKLAYDLYSMGIPTAAVLAGHAIAGGHILAMTTDFRFAVQGRKQIGLNEIKLGIPVPYLADLILRQVVGDRVATEMIFGGEFMTVDQALHAKVVDDLFQADVLETKVIQKIASLASMDGAAFGAVKANRVEPVRLKYQQHYQARNQFFIDAWFSPDVQKKLKQAAKHF
jgi:enoyl-CoA hydratase/carnithine racemase